MPKRGDTVYIPFNKMDAKMDEALNHAITSFSSKGIKCIYKDTKAKKLYEIEKLYVIGHCGKGSTSLSCNNGQEWISAEAKSIANTLVPKSKIVMTKKIKVVACEGAAHGKEGDRFITALKNQIIKKLEDKDSELIEDKITVYGCKRKMVIKYNGKSAEYNDSGDSVDDCDYKGTDGSYKPDYNYSMSRDNEEVKFSGDTQSYEDTQSYNTSNENGWWCVIS